MAELHSSLALLLVGLTVGLVVGLHMVDVPERVRRAGRSSCVVMVAQAAVGYTQYFTHLPALVVEVHVIGCHRPRDRGGPVLLGLHLPPVAKSVSAPAEERSPSAAGVPISAR